MDMPGLAAMSDAVIEGDHCAIYPFRNESGEGTITIYEVFPGVCLAYNDFHMRYYDSAFRPGQDLLCIDHCREGLSAPVIKCKKTPRKKCSFVAKEAKKR